MKNEKVFVLEMGRLAKVITRGKLAEDFSKVIIETEVLIKDAKDEDFHPPIQLSHPKYWKLKKLSAEQARILQFKYSGLTEKHLKKSIKEFEKTFNQEVLN